MWKHHNHNIRENKTIMTNAPHNKEEKSPQKILLDTRMNAILENQEKSGISPMFISEKSLPHNNDWEKFLQEFYAYCSAPNPEGKTELIDYKSWAEKIADRIKTEKDLSYKEGEVKGAIQMENSIQFSQKELLEEIEKIGEEWFVAFVEYGTYTKSVQAGRIELIPVHGDLERDTFEIGTIVLPMEKWAQLRKQHDGKRFGKGLVLKLLSQRLKKL